MKKGLGILLIAVLAAAVLSGCTQSDVESSKAGAGGSGSAASGSGTVEAAGGTASGSGTIEAPASDTGSQAESVPADNSVSGEASVGTIVSEEITAEENAPVFDGGVSVEEDMAEETDALVGEENLSDEELAALEEGEDPSQEEGWIGSYVNEAEEVLTVSSADSSAITFAFANAGISGTAELNGNQATYGGDDHHTVVFEFSGTDIKVTVLSEEDYDASGSPINGVFVRQ